MSHAWIGAGLLAAFLAKAHAQPPFSNPFAPPSTATTGAPFTGIANTPTSTSTTPTPTPTPTSTPTTLQTTTNPLLASTRSVAKTASSKSRVTPSSSSSTTATSSVLPQNTSPAGQSATSTSTSAASSSTLGSAAQNGVNPVASHSGMSSSAKIGIGVGVGVGLALLALLALLAFLFMQRRKKRRDRESHASAEKLRHASDRPAMASGVPALAGAAALGRSTSNASSQYEPRTPSRHSSIIAHEAATPADATAEPKSLRSPPRQPPQLILPTHEPAFDDSFAAPGYLGTQSALDGRSGEVSPVSGVSPVDSRPPSPLSERDL
ncbi:hypothetical protein BDY17DRAFT_320485 [Neohortaea acidophila]|uniref:Mid2 domain-containing protein n=1 Tax=Neohortaea acidophila TaxID=245834 RepID=A0A6A6Q7Q7_9PEZI|nr:uncharacterized protein BDY17DRAFT_320485 [Neohortaea acidophila]KAF2487976.1 hypothetical protein BDY17DRAFT_320485 [Neohortaea acidophila]